MRDSYVLWQSLRSDDRLALEIQSATFSLKRFSELVRSALVSQPSVAFLFFRVVPSADLDLIAIAATIGSLEPMSSARLCLAGKLEVLKTFAAAGLDGDQIGLMLDDVNPETPPSDLLWDRIEAVRFAPAFIAQASRDLRQACALKSMLTLCHDIGLCTLGRNAVSALAGPAHRTDFDYVLDIPNQTSKLHAGTNDRATPTGIAR